MLLVKKTKKWIVPSSGTASFTGPVSTVRDWQLSLTNTSTGLVSSSWTVTGAGGVVATSTETNPTFDLQEFGADNYDVELEINGDPLLVASDSFDVLADGLWIGPLTLLSGLVTVPITVATDDAGTPLVSPTQFAFEMWDADGVQIVNKPTVVWGDDPNTDWTTTGVLYSTSTVEQGGSIIFATDSRSAYRVKITTSGTYPTSHERTIVLHPAIPSVASGYTRITSLNSAMDSGEVSMANMEFAAWTPDDQTEFAAVGVDGLTYGLRNALDANSDTYPTIYQPTNGGPDYLRSLVNTKRRCQHYLSMAGATGLPGMALTRGVPYRFGYDFRIPDTITWWDEFKGTSFAALDLSEFHIDQTDDIYKSGGPSGTLLFSIYSRGDVGEDPYMQLRIAGDDLIQTTDRGSWSCGMLDDGGRTWQCYPFNSYSWSNSTATLFDLDFVLGKWYRIVMEFTLDILQAGTVKVWCNEIDEFAEDSGSLIIDETGITNCNLIYNTASSITMREPQIGISNNLAETMLWLPSESIYVDHSQVFFDKV